MSRSLYLFLSVCLACVLVTTGCRKDSEDNPVNPGTNKPTVLTTIAGIVSDENGNALSGITVSTHGKTAVSNQYGLFVVKDVRVPQDRCFILARQDGYFTASRAEVPKANGVTNMRLSMMTNSANYSVSASAGGTVNISGGGIVEFPANGFSTESGQPYTGTVKVAARWLNPSSKTFYDFFPGDFTATRTDGSETLLYSYGVLNVELYSTTGAKVKMATGKQATLKYPIPSSMLSGAPSEMPLWYFDEGIGMWKEEGKAVKQGSFYVGEVTHFTPWNCDIPETTAVVRGHVRCDNDNVPNIRVQVGQREVITDENGYYEVRVPAGLEFEISVDAAKNLGSGTVTPIPVGPLSNQQTFTQDVAVTPCPAYLTGTLTDCNGDPVEGVVQAIGTTNFGYMVVNGGQFRMRVEPNVQLTVNAIGYNGGVGEPLTVEPVTSGTTRNVGTLQLCPQTAITYTDIPLLSEEYVGSLALSNDGSMLAVGAYNSIEVYDAQTGTLLQNLTIQGIAGSVSFSNDDTKLMYSNDSASGGMNGKSIIWNTSTWQQIQDFTSIGTPVFMPDGNSVMSIDFTSQELVQYSVASGAELNRFTVVDRPFKLMGTRANGTEIVYISYDNNQAQKVAVWDISTNTLARTMSLAPEAYVWEARLSSDGNRLGIPTWSQNTYFYDMSNGQLISTVTGSINGARSIALALEPSSTQFAMQTNDKNIMLPPALYNMINGSLIRFLPSPTNGQFMSFTYSGNGSKLAGTWRTTVQPQVRVWNLP